MTTKKMFETMSKAINEVYNLKEVLRDLNGSENVLVTYFRGQKRGLWFNTEDMTRGELYESLALEAVYGAVEKNTYRRVYVSQNIVEILKRNWTKGSLEEGYVHMLRTFDNKLHIVDLHRVEGYEKVWEVTFNK